MGAHGLDARNILGTAYLEIYAASKIEPSWKRAALDQGLRCSMLPEFLDFCKR